MPRDSYVKQPFHNSEYDDRQSDNVDLSIASGMSPSNVESRQQVISSIESVPLDPVSETERYRRNLQETRASCASVGNTGAARAFTNGNRVTEDQAKALGKRVRI